MTVEVDVDPHVEERRMEAVGEQRFGSVSTVRLGRERYGSASAPETAKGVCAPLSDAPRAWVVIEGGRPPPDWADRAAEAWVVRLVPGEVQEILSEKRAQPALDHAELRLARLVARGLTTLRIAEDLGFDHRTVQRQVARLREKLGVRSKGELTALLAEAGL